MPAQARSRSNAGTIVQYVFRACITTSNAATPASRPNVLLQVARSSIKKGTKNISTTTASATHCQPLAEPPLVPGDFARQIARPDNQKLREGENTSTPSETRVTGCPNRRRCWRHVLRAESAGVDGDDRSDTVTSDSSSPRSSIAARIAGSPSIQKSPVRKRPSMGRQDAARGQNRTVDRGVPVRFERHPPVEGGKRHRGSEQHKRQRPDSPHAGVVAGGWSNRETSPSNQATNSHTAK